MSNLNCRQIKLKEFIKQVAIQSRVSRQLTYEVIVVFVKLFREWLRIRREIHIPRLGKFYLKKSFYVGKDKQYQFDKIVFKPSARFKDYINGRRKYERSNRED